MPPYSQSAVGKEAVRKAYDAVFAELKFDVKFTIAELVVMAPNWAYVRTNSAGTTGHASTGKTTAEANQELFIFRKGEDGAMAHRPLQLLADESARCLNEVAVGAAAEEDGAMKAVFIRRYGGPEVLEYGDFPDPEVGAGDVLVKVAAAAINPIDIMERSGLTKDFKPVSFPGVLGMGPVGDGRSTSGRASFGFSVGDKVLAWAYHTYAELCSVKAELLAKVPDGLDLVEAAALPLVTTTGEPADFCRGRDQGRADRARFRRVRRSGPLGRVHREGARSEGHRRRAEEATGCG